MYLYCSSGVLCWNNWIVQAGIHWSSSMENKSWILYWCSFLEIISWKNALGPLKVRCYFDTARRVQFKLQITTLWLHHVQWNIQLEDKTKGVEWKLELHNYTKVSGKSLFGDLIKAVQKKLQPGKLHWGCSELQSGVCIEAMQQKIQLGDCIRAVP